MNALSRLFTAESTSCIESMSVILPCLISRQLLSISSWVTLPLLSLSSMSKAAEAVAASGKKPAKSSALRCHGADGSVGSGRERA